MATTKVIPGVLDLNESTSESGLKMPTGDNNNRPTAATGQIRNNTNETSTRIGAENGHRGVTSLRLRIIVKETWGYPTGYLRAKSDTIKYGRGL